MIGVFFFSSCSLLKISVLCSQTVFGLCSCREKSDKAAGGEASGSSQGGGHLRSVKDGQRPGFLRTSAEYITL